MKFTLIKALIAITGLVLAGAAVYKWG